MKYSYWCKTCGFTSFSDNKEEIKRIQKVHTRPMYWGDPRHNRCNMMPVGDGTIARLDLIDKLKEMSE
jgi:hypothetical protein